MLALTAPRAFVSPKSFIVKDDKMKKYVIAGLIAAGVLATNASAALTAAQVDMGAATTDIGMVAGAIIGVLVLAFGLKKVFGFLGGK